MDPRQLFFDDRFRYMCAYCGGLAETRDHVPSRVLLDPPYPPDLPVVGACERCNNAFSRDEPYLACLVDCVIRGVVQPSGGSGRAKIARLLREKPHLAADMERARHDDLFGAPRWHPDLARVAPIILKLARGHMAFEFGEPRLDEPTQLGFAPLESLSAEQRHRFESAGELWPEIGSRAFLRASVAAGSVHSRYGWTTVQEGRYRFLAVDEANVKFVLSEYLACQVLW